MLAGYLVIGVLVVVTDRIMGTLGPGGYDPSKPSPPYYFVVSITTASLYSVLGGYVCAWLSVAAKLNPWKHVIGLVIFGELMGIASTVMYWGQQPAWYAFGLLLLYPLCVLFGGKLRLHKQPA